MRLLDILPLSVLPAFEEDRLHDATNLFDMIEFSAAQVCGSCLHLAPALLLELFLDRERGIFRIFCCICHVGGNHNLECLCIPGVSIISVFRNSLIRKT